MREMRVLVVEDEPMVALDFAAILQDEGYEVIGPARSIDHALDIIGRQPRLDHALVDIHLQGRTVEPVAEALQQRGVGFAFVTGSGQEAIPERFRDAPLVQKPCRIAELLKALEHSRRH